MSVFNICFMTFYVVNSTSGWGITCMVPLYKVKGDVHECSNFRGFKLSCGRKSV